MLLVALMSLGLLETRADNNCWANKGIVVKVKYNKSQRTSSGLSIDEYLYGRLISCLMAMNRAVEQSESFTMKSNLCPPSSGCKIHHMKLIICA